MSEQSPLLTADADALTQLFEADPLTLSDAQIMRSILELRRRRSEFAAKEAADQLKVKRSRTRPEPQSAATAALLDKPPGELSLEDI